MLISLGQSQLIRQESVLNFGRKLLLQPIIVKFLAKTIQCSLNSVLQLDNTVEHCKLLLAIMKLEEHQLLNSPQLKSPNIQTIAVVQE